MSSLAHPQLAHRWSLTGAGLQSAMRAGGALVAMLAVCAWLLASVAIWLLPAPACIVGEKDDVGCVHGFQARERDDGADRVFRWTDGTATLRLSGAGYGSPRAIALELAAARPPDSPMPRVTLNTGQSTATFVADTPPRRYLLLLPDGFPTGDVAHVDITSDTMIMPNGRELGVAVYEAHILQLGAFALAGPLLTLALLGLGLSGALVTATLQKTAQRRTLVALLAGMVAMLLAIGLWTWHPLRVVPMLPWAAMLIGISIIGLRRLAVHESTISSSQRVYGALLLISAIAGICLANGLLDWVIMEGIAKRRQIPWVVLAQTLITLGAFWWLGRVARTQSFSLAFILATALSVRLLAFAVRVLTGRVPNDADTELFYNYGRATIELGVPEVEYPSGALVVWAALALPGSRELFLLLVPLLNLVCDLVIAWGIWFIGRIAARREGDKTAPIVAGYAALCYALSPLLLPFWHAKFDPVPAALVILALVAYAAERPWWAGVALGLGGSVKWAPWVAVPFPGWAWLRPGARSWPNWRALILYAAGFTISVIALALPFALYDWAMFLAPYRIQGSRQFIGESIWYPIALLFEPELQGRRAPPYAGLPSEYLSSGLMVGVQLLALVLLGLVQFLRPQSWRRTLILTALAPTAFFLLNRVFSPQYAVVIVACVYAAAAVTLSLRQAVTLVTAITIMEAANLLVWPYTQSYWLWPSIVNLGIGVAVTIWLAVKAWRQAGDGVTS